MSSTGNNIGPTVIRADGIDIASIPFDAPSQRALDGWSSGARMSNDPRREILRVDFRNRRLINNLTFDLSDVPLHLKAEYLLPSGEWTPLLNAPARFVEVVNPDPGANLGGPVEIISHRCQPSTYGPSSEQGARVKANWETYDFKVGAILTSAIRLVTVRVRGISGPFDHNNRNPLPYPISIRNLLIGYRIDNDRDVPAGFPKESSLGSDALGSRVDFDAYRQLPNNIVDDNTTTYWRSEPQPVANAVVSAYLDVRDEQGDPTVIDRFWIDPVTVGVSCNLYYATEMPKHSFRGLNTKIPDKWVTSTTPAPVTATDPTTGRPASIRFTTSSTHETDSRAWLGDLGFDWWVGADLLVPAAGEQRILTASFMSLSVDASGRFVIRNSPTSSPLTLLGSVDPLMTIGARVRVVVGFRYVSGMPITLTLSWAVDGHDPVTEVLNQNYGSGLDRRPIIVGGGDLTAFGYVVKSETLAEETLAWFLTEGADYLADPQTHDQYRGADLNALLRMHPAFVETDNPYGVVGGVGSTYEALVWTPISGDYTLRKGYLAVPPTRASVWKFEMTNLSPEVYENFTPIDRRVKFFPSNVIAHCASVAGPYDDEGAPPGSALTQTADQWSDTNRVTAQQRTAATSDPNRATVLVLRDPTQAARAAESGWIWQYQAWHAGSRAPRFLHTGRHIYIETVIRHTAKIGYFAGLTEIRPLRTNYAVVDDTAEYIEPFLDTAGIDTSTSTVMTPMGLTSTGRGEVTGKTMWSYRSVRGVQFATQQPDRVQVLEDPDFIAPNMLRWVDYGDGKAQRLGPNRVRITRGWRTNTYGDLEETYGTYAGLEGRTYLDLEGFYPTGSAEGGVESMPYTPRGSGEIEAVAEVYTDSALGADLSLEIVDAVTGVVIVRVDQQVTPGEACTLRVSASASGSRIAYTWGDHEAKTYIEMEESTYAGLESVEGSDHPLVARLVQHGETQDTFFVSRIALYESPVAWYFSNDDGTTWWQAIGIRNNPHGVLTFPTFFATGDQEVGRGLKWKAKISGEGIVISSLHIRPWYGTRGRGAETSYGNDAQGPNLSARDNARPVYLHPMWQQTDNPIEHVFVPEVPVWRNLATNPSGEGIMHEGDWITEGATVETVPGGLGTGGRSIEFTITEDI